MAKIFLDLLKDLRRKTSAGVSDCKQALEDAKGDLVAATKLLRKRGLEIAQSKSARVAHQGKIESYIHTGSKLGVLLEVNCETDFVARNEDFCQFTKNLAMQIAATDPAYIKREDIPEDVVKDVKNIDEFCKQNCLIDQAFIRDGSLVIKDLLADLIAKIGENIVIRRFTRYKIGDE